MQVLSDEDLARRFDYAAVYIIFLRTIGVIIVVAITTITIGGNMFASMSPSA